MLYEVITPVGPGDNRFGLHEDNVVVNQKGELILKILQKEGKWSCAELVSKDKFSEGYYELVVQSDLSRLSSGVVLGLFLYDDNKAPYFDEVDFEFSSWGIDGEVKAQFVVHQDSLEKHHRAIPFRVKTTVHQLFVKQDSIVFLSRQDHEEPPYMEHTFARPQNFTFENTHFRINLWLYHPSKLSRKRKVSKVIIKSFSYVPIGSINR